MYLFPVPPSPLQRINAQCVRLRWRQDRLFFFYFLFFKDLKLRIKKTQTHPLTMICEVVFFLWETRYFFSNSMKGLWHLLSSQLHLTVCRVFVSLIFVFLVFFFLFSLNDCTPGKLNSKPLCVSRCRQNTVDLHLDRRLLYLFKFAHPGCCHTAAIVI